MKSEDRYRQLEPGSSQRWGVTGVTGVTRHLAARSVTPVTLVTRASMPRARKIETLVRHHLCPWMSNMGRMCIAHREELT